MTYRTIRRPRPGLLLAIGLSMQLAWTVRGGLPGSEVGDDVHAVAVAPAGDRVAAACGDVVVVDGSAGAVLWRGAGDLAEARSAAFSPDGSTLASGHRDGTIRLWDAAAGSETGTISAHKLSVNGIAFSADGQRLATASSDCTVAVWDVGSGERIALCEGHVCTVNSVAFSPVDDVVASASSDTTVRLWSASSGEALSTLEGHGSSVWSVSWSPNGAFLASGSRDMSVRVWEAASGQAVRILEGHSSTVRGVAFSPDGVHVASASWDRSVRVWDIRSGREMGVYRGHLQPVRALAYMPGGERLVSGSAYEEQPLRVWTEGVPFAPDAAPAVLPVAAVAPEPGTGPADFPPVELTPGRQAWRDASHPEETYEAIQAALDAARTGDSRRVVLLPPGRYLLTRPVTLAGVTLRGPGAVLIARNVTDTYFFGLTLGSGARLEDIQVLGEGGRCVPVRFANPASDVRLRDVHIRDGTILLNGQAHIENIVIDTCLFEDGGYGLLLDRPSSGRNVRVTNCTFRNNRSDAIELNFPHHEHGKVVEDIVIANSIFEGTGRDPDNGNAGFSIGMAGARCVQIVGNSFRRAAVQAVHIEDGSEQITISANNFTNCGVDHTRGNWTGGVHVLSGSRRITINGNTFTNCRFGVSGLQAHQLRWCAITGNTFQNSDIGIRIMQFPRGVIQGNLFEDCQTAVNIWRTPLWNVSGNVIVTTLPDAVGLRCTRFQTAVITGNTIQAPIPIDHREAEGDRGESLVGDNLLIPVE